MTQYRILGAVALALLAAGCGSAARSTTSRKPATPRPSAQSSAGAATTTASPASGQALSTYHQLGLTFHAPAGFAVSPAPVGASIPAVGLTPGGHDPSSASEQIVVFDNTRPNSSNVSVIAAHTQGVDSVGAHTQHITGYRSSMGKASVAGAWDTVTLTETYSAVLPGSSTPAAVKREWIFIQVGPRHFRELLAVSVPSRGATLDPAQVASSITLGS